MSQLLRDVIGHVLPERPALDKTPVPYRSTKPKAMPRSLTNEGSTGEPSEADTPITEQPATQLSFLGDQDGLPK